MRSIKKLLGLLWGLMIFVLPGCLFSSQGSSPLRSPEDVVAEFYERYFSCLYSADVKMIDSCAEVRIKHPYLTENNRARVEKAIEGSPDFDPLFCASNLPDQNFDVGPAQISQDQATLEVTFYYEGNPHVVPLKLKAQDGTWQIDSLLCREPY